MKQLIRYAFTSMVITGVLFAGTARAQIAQSLVKAHIPFQFNVGEKTFPAGDYSITQPLQNFLMLRDARGRTVASTFTQPVQGSTAPDKPELRFHFSGGQHTLTEVWESEVGVGQQLPSTTNAR